MSAVVVVPAAAGRVGLARMTPGMPGDGWTVVSTPGEPESRYRAERLAKGIPVQTDTWAAICATARDLGVEPPALPNS